MINNSRNYRMLQIAAMILYRNIPNITLVQSDDNVYDILCSCKSPLARMAVPI